MEPKSKTPVIKKPAQKRQRTKAPVLTWGVDEEFVTIRIPRKALTAELLGKLLG